MTSHMKLKNHKLSFIGLLSNMNYTSWQSWSILASQFLKSNKLFVRTLFNGSHYIDECVKKLCQEEKFKSHASTKLFCSYSIILHYASRNFLSETLQLSWIIVIRIMTHYNAIKRLQIIRFVILGFKMMH